MGNGHVSRGRARGLHDCSRRSARPAFAIRACFWEQPRTVCALVIITASLATVHKARLQWLNATDAMLEESRNWLLNQCLPRYPVGKPSDIRVRGSRD
jgi:hypothetical protein